MATIKLNGETGQMERVGGATYPIKDGVFFDVKQLLADVRSTAQQEQADASQRSAQQ